MLDDCPPLVVALLSPLQPLQMKVKDLCPKLRPACNLQGQCKTKMPGTCLESMKAALNRRQAPSDLGSGGLRGSCETHEAGPASHCHQGSQALVWGSV